jgi:hypothetical protein
MTPQTPIRRVARLTVPWQYHITKPSVELGWVRLLDLSSEGARIEHPEPVQEGEVCAVDLVPALEWGRLTGRVVWTRPRTPARTFEGDTRVHYQSGLAFVDITPEQRVALAVALEILQTGKTK